MVNWRGKTKTPPGLWSMFDFSAVSEHQAKYGVRNRVLNADTIIPTNNAPDVISAKKGQRFGNSKHFDDSCSGTLSLQLVGQKQWYLWAPFDLGNITAHTRYETILNPGDVLIYPPGWYHTTKIISDTNSIATAVFVEHIPWYAGVVGNLSLWKSPRGWEFCASGKDDPWRPMGAEWDLAMNISSSCVVSTGDDKRSTRKCFSGEQWEWPKEAGNGMNMLAGGQSESDKGLRTGEADQEDSDFYDDDDV
jgi:hypothetical protein